MLLIFIRCEASSTSQSILSDTSSRSNLFRQLPHNLLSYQDLSLSRTVHIIKTILSMKKSCNFYVRYKAIVSFLPVDRVANEMGWECHSRLIPHLLKLYFPSLCSSTRSPNRQSFYVMRNHYFFLYGNVRTCNRKKKNLYIERSSL